MEKTQTRFFSIASMIDLHRALLPMAACCLSGAVLVPDALARSTDWTNPVALLLADEGNAGVATIVVDTAADVVAEDGACSLREAIINANNDDQSGAADCAPGGAAPDEIVFDVALAGGTITLGGTPLPAIVQALGITGPVADDPAGIVLDADGQSRVATVDTAIADIVVELNNLTLTGGRTTASGDAGSGGALFAGGVSFENGTLVLQHVAITDSRVEGDSARGGGLGALDTNVMLIDTTISGNSALGTGGFGGGLSATGNGDFIMHDSRVIGNDATSDGTARAGGLYLGEGSPGTILVENSLIEGNTATGRGGGFFVVVNNLTPTQIVNSTISGNTAATTGGGIFMVGAMEVVHSTIAFNQDDADADGVFVSTVAGGSQLIHNSLIVQDAPGEVACANVDLVTNSLATDASCDGVATPAADIALDPLADNGGPTVTHAIAETSVAIDTAGDCVTDFDITTDQRGVARPQGDGCDIGAFELEVEPPEDEIFSDRFEVLDRALE